ncbi:NifU family protein [Aquimarina agarilytica]|uniref:NifU family protein n=1 Tax=Aquimarina agarilytica TaxID=1087449 RepID=UPI000289568C|nr:NifU family protein [Aquimarina agarilytica]
MKKYTVKVVPTSHEGIMKFEANYFLTQHISYEFENIEEAKISPLAQQLFHLPFVKQIYIAQNFVAINKYDIVEWADVQREVAEQIEAYLNEGHPVIDVVNTSSKKVPVTVYAESTPNPGVQKFVANKKLVLQTLEFKNIDEAIDAPLPTALFNFPFVKEVFLDDNYVSITKYDRVEWNDISNEIREFLRDYLEQGKEVIKEEAFKTQSSETSNEVANESSYVNDENLDDVSKQIIAIIDEYVKPAVASDGGNIQFQNYDATTQKVEVILQGACSGCPSSTFTLKNGIENMLKEMLPGKIATVEAING